MNNEEKYKCSFCLKDYAEVRNVIIGESSSVCNECVTLCNEAIDIFNYEDTSDFLLLPIQIFEALNKDIIGQEKAKKILAVAVYNHYKILAETSPIEKNDIEKTNVLIVGPTGCGKTLLVQTLADLLNVPFVTVDATTLTEVGYAGEDVESVIVRLFHAAAGDVWKTETGIVYIDEIDKISRKSENNSKDISGEGVQQALLKLMEGMIVSVQSQEGSKQGEEEVIDIDTKNILFICSGAFIGLEKIIKKRKSNTAIGFTAPLSNDVNNQINNKLFSNIEPEDLIKFGLIPEFIGRLSQIVAVSSMSKEMLIRILVEPENSLINQYKKLFLYNNVNLIFQDSSLDEIAKIAIKRNIGARGLRSVIESILIDVMFEIPSKNNVTSVVVDGECVRRLSKPRYIEDKKTTKSI